MTAPRPCPHCSRGPLKAHGSRSVDVAYVEADRLRWEHATIARFICRSCARTSGLGEAEAEAAMRVARSFVCRVYALRGMDAAVEASGVTDRTVERWAEIVADDVLRSELPPRILLSVSGRSVLVSDASDGTPLDAAPGDARAIAGGLSARGGDVEVAWIWPSVRLREGVERAFPKAEIRMPPRMARDRLDALLAAIDIPGGSVEARLLSERVHGSGWDAIGIAILRACWRSRGGPGDGFLSLWSDEILAGLDEWDPVHPVGLPEDPSPSRLRALAATRCPDAGAPAGDPSCRGSTSEGS